MSQSIKPSYRFAIVTACLLIVGCGGNPHQRHARGMSNDGNGNPVSQNSPSNEFDRGCSDAKDGSYDRSGNAGKAYEEGWNSCKSGGAASGAAYSSAPLGQTAPVAQELVGSRAAGGMEELERRGLQFVRTETSGGGKDSYWRELGTGGCVVARTMDGKIASATYTSPGDCK